MFICRGRIIFDWHDARYDIVIHCLCSIRRVLCGVVLVVSADYLCYVFLLEGIDISCAFNGLTLTANLSSCMKP